MRHVKQWVPSRRLLNTVLATCATLAFGCTGDVSPGANGNGGSGNPTGSGGVIGTATGGSGPGTGGAAPATPCAGATDPRLVVAPQRLVRLTLIEVVNSIRSMFDATQATAIAQKYMLGSETERTFPPLNSPREGVSIISDRWSTLDQIGQDLATYVGANFATVTKCPATPTDQCATAYLNTLAEKAYRRPLDTAEQTRLTALYNTLKSTTANGVTLTSTIQEATQNAVYAIMGSPQFLYRSELGNKTAPLSTSPPGVPLTAHEVATQLAFFITGAPPDQPLLDVAKAGTLTTDKVLTEQVNRLLGTQAAKDNLTTAMYTYYKLNLLPNVVIDPAKFPNFNTGTRDDMGTEGRKFLDYTLWSGNLTDLLTSRTTFLNTNLATNVYKVPVPAGATVTNFVQTTLPAERSGIVTNAGFLTSRARTDVASVVARGLVVKEAMLCLTTPPPPSTLMDQVDAARANLKDQTAQQQVASRATGVCGGCHAHFDAYGLVLENFNAIAGWRTQDDAGRPVDASVTLPPALGGAKVMSAPEFAQALSTAPGWINCMAKSVLQYALTDVTSAPVDVAGCAVTEVASRYTAAPAKTFTELVRDVALAKATLVRAKVQ